MQIKVTLGELSEVVGSLNSFVKIPLPAKYAYRFQKVAKFLQSEWNDLKQHHDDLVRKYGKMNDDGTSIQVTPENIAEYVKDRNDLLGETITIDFEPMPVSLLEDGKMSIQDMAWLDRFFVDDVTPQVAEIEKQLKITEPNQVSDKNVEIVADKKKRSKQNV